MRIARLDGIRTVAVLMVILLHHHMLSLGWTGVDLFFVLSGFLITGILRRERTAPHYWQSFYVKRATRILPPLLLLIPLSYVVTKHATIKAALAYLCFAANIQDLGAHAIPLLGGLWSLSVEEHFYLVWPFAVYGLSRPSLIRLLGALLLLEPVLRGVATHWCATPDPIYLLTPFRLDGLAIGSLLALMVESEQTRTSLAKWAGPCCVGAVCVYSVLKITRSGFDKDSNTLLFNTAGYSLTSLIMGCIIAYVFLRPETVVSRCLSLRPLVLLGEISYGMYLFQSIVIAVMEKLAHVTSYPASPAILHKIVWLDIPIIIGISWISFKGYELPMMRWGKRMAQSLSS